MKNFYRDSGLVLSVVSLVCITVALTTTLYFLNQPWFWLLMPFVLLTSILGIVKVITVTRKTFQYVEIIQKEVDLADSSSLHFHPIAIGIIDSAGCFVWFNNSFTREFSDKAQCGIELSAITTVSMDLLLSPNGAQIQYGNKHYKVNAHVPREETASVIYLIYFEDITRTVFLELEKELSNPVVMLIVIDSYEEIFASNSESRTAAITVQIDKLLEDYIKTTTGILKKTGRDRFWAVVEERHAAALIENKVKLLDQAREIAVTDRISVTLSIGIGKTATVMSESEAYARSALEMALGRGGDQAAVKTASGFEFYGGYSKGVERHTKVRVRIIANSLLDLVGSSDIVYIMGHKFSDLDSIGSAVGLACGLRNLGYSAYIVIDRITTLGLSLIEKIEENLSGETELFIDPSMANAAWTEKSLLIIVDAHTKKMLECPELYDNAKKVVVIDHHRKVVDFIEDAAIFHHEVMASSTSEMVTELLQYFGAGSNINAVQAEALLAGIMLDTKNFSFKAGVRTFEAAAFLRKLGADTSNVRPLFANTIENYKLKTALVGNAVIYKCCAVTSTEDSESDIRILAPQAADELLEIVDVEASFLIYRTSTNEVSISARSIGKINVQIIMESLGGGGHLTMAGAQFSNMGVAEIKQLLLEKIDVYFEDKE